MTNTLIANRLEAAARRHHADLGRSFRQQAETLRAAVETAQGYFPLPKPTLWESARTLIRRARA